MSVKKGLFIFVLSICVSNSAYAQIINGSFEAGSFELDDDRVMSLSVGSTVMTGWTTFGAELTWLRFDNIYVSPPSDGNFFLDLTGYHDSSPYGGVQQSVTTLAGNPYRLTFDLGVHNGNPLYLGPITVRVAATGNAFQDFTYNPGGNTVQWGTFNYDFTATGTSTEVSFLGISTAGTQYIGLDNVSLTVAVPEPASWAMLGLVTLAIGGWFKLSKKRIRDKMNAAI